MVLDAPGLALLLLSVASLVLFLCVSLHARRRVKSSPEEAAETLARGLVDHGNRAGAARVIRRNTGWSRQLTERYVSGLSRGDAQLPDIVDDYPDLPRDARAWVALLVAEGEQEDAARFVAAHTDWPEHTARAYLRRYNR